MFGIMGVDAGFINAAKAKAKKASGNYLTFRGSQADPTIYQISCVGEISVESIKDGQPVVQTYSDLETYQLAIQADAETDITIKGSVTAIVFAKPYGDWWKLLSLSGSSSELLSLSCNRSDTLTELSVSDFSNLTELNANTTGITSIDLSHNTALESVNLGSTGITSIDLSNNTALKFIDLSSLAITAIDLANNGALEHLQIPNCEYLQSLDLLGNVLLSNLSCSGCIGLTEIKYSAANSDVSTAVAGAIANATAADGTVYTDSAGAYYSTIEAAATTKGWTIEQLS